MTDFTPANDNQGDSNVRARVKTPSRRTGLLANFCAPLGVTGVLRRRIVVPPAARAIRRHAAAGLLAAAVSRGERTMACLSKHNSNEGDSQVSSHAKAESEGSTQRRVARLGPVFPKAFAAGEFWDDANGTSTSSPPGFGTTLATLLGVFVLSLVFLATNAKATITHNTEPFSPLDGTGSGLTLQQPQAVALDETTGNVFVNDGNRVAILGEEGGPPIGLAAPFEIANVEVENGGLAYDDSTTSSAKGTLYAFDPATGSVKKFTRDPITEQYELAAEEISVPNAFIVGLSVDTAGDLYVGNFAGGSHDSAIYKYSPSGSLLAEYDLAESSSGAAGQAAVDEQGDLFVADQNKGLYEFPVDGSGEIDLDVYTRLVDQGVAGVTIDPATDDVYAALATSIAEYDAATGGKLSEFGSEVIQGNSGISMNSAAERLYAADSGNSVVNVFGSGVVVPTATIAAASEVTGTRATLNGSVDPEEIAVEECFFEWGETTSYGNVAPCEGATPPDADAHLVHADVFGLTSDGTTYHFRLVAKNENGTERSPDETFITARTVLTETPTDVSTTSATFHGTVRPEGSLYSVCKFEYGLTSSFGFEDETPCDPPAASISPGVPSQAVVASVSVLQSNSDYKFRLTATNPAGSVQGETLTFSTVGPPRITETLARDADQDSATLGATIDPRGGETSYRIEWGPTDSYGNTASIGTVAAGEGPKAVSARIAGLSPATTYHYRVVASSTEGGQTATPDQQIQTLNACGFTDGRCLELVSRPDKGPLAGPGKSVLVGSQIQWQAAAQGSALAYTVESGYPETTAGVAAALYLGRRSSAGWNSEQLNPPTDVPPLGAGPAGISRFKVLSSDLGCGVIASLAPLAAGAPAGVVEAGGENLYRRDNATGSYDLITHLPPVGPPSRNEIEVRAPEYQVVGMSPDCRRVIFRTPYRYPGIPTAGAGYQLYEWDNGALRNLALIPGPGGIAEPVPAESIPGALDRNPGSEGEAVGEKEPTDYWHSVSTDASRSDFTAVSQSGADIGRRAIFLRDADDPAVIAGTAPAIDISQSETATPNDANSRYWTASVDGSRVFFTSRYGLGANGSSAGATSCANAPFNGGVNDQGSGEGCDLYEYDLDAPAGERLTDLSPDTDDPRGAGVVGVLDASEDGSFVYFAARGRLGGAGRTEAENLKEGTYNIYLAHAGAVRFLAPLGVAEALGGNALVDTVDNEQWTSRATDDGTSFAFESSLGGAGGGPMVFFYSAADGTIACVSCRHDGQAPFSEYHLTPLFGSLGSNPANRTVRPTILTDNGRLYFYSLDPLAPDAVEGARNLFQWERGQISLIATESQTVPRDPSGSPIASFFGGASADGGDVYFATPQSLTGAATEGWNVYDARVEGGFPEPAPPAPPCDASAEGACNSAGANPPAGAPPTTSTFTGPSNPSATKHKSKHHKKKHHKKKHHKKKHHKKKHHKKKHHKKKHHKKKHHKKKHHKKTGKAGRATGGQESD